MFTMAVFGLGTVPAILFFGFLVTRLQPHLKLFLYRIAAVLLLDIRTFLRGMTFDGWTGEALVEDAVWTNALPQICE
jgi:sulfite exporter TauE/SafE